MVAFKAAQTASFIRAPDTRFVAALVYGPEASLVAERTRELARKVVQGEKPGAEVLRLGDRELSENPDRLAVELKTQSMFAERRVVVVRSERQLKADELKGLLSGDLEAYLIVESGNLRPSSALRKLFETGERTAALPCYSDPARDLGSMIDNELAAPGVRLTRETRVYLMSRLGTDLALARSECAKLATYAGPGEEITPDDIDAVIGDMGGGALDALANTAAEGKTGEALRHLDRLLAGGREPHAALSALSRHFQRLHRLCAAIEAGVPARTAIARFRPPLHFRQRDALLAQTRKWDGQSAARALQRVQETTRATRRTPALNMELTQRLLIALAGG